MKNIKIGYVTEIQGKQGTKSNDIQARATMWDNLNEKIIALISLMGMDLEKVKQLLSYRSIDGIIFINSLGDVLRFNRERKSYTPLTPRTHDKSKINVEGEKGYQNILNQRVHKLVAINFLANPKNIPADWYDEKYGRNKYQVNHINNYKWDNFILNLNLVDDAGNKKHAKEIKKLIESNEKTIYFTRSSKEFMLDDEFLAKNPNAKIYRNVNFKGDLMLFVNGEWMNIENKLIECLNQVEEKNREYFKI